MANSHKKTKVFRFPFSVLILLCRLFLLAARKNANKFAFFSRSASSVPFIFVSLRDYIVMRGRIRSILIVCEEFGDRRKVQNLPIRTISGI